MSKPRKPRVFIGLFEIAGYYANLQRGLEELGCSTRLVSLTHHPFGYEEPACGWLGEFVKWHFRRALKVAGHIWPKWMPPWLQRFTGWLAVWLVAWQHDVFLFSYGLSFADGLMFQKLEPLRRLKRKVVFIFNGSDSRAPYCDRTGYFIEGRITTTKSLLSLTRDKAQRLQRIHELADLVIDYPLSGHFHTRRYINFIRLGIPTVISEKDEAVQPPGAGWPGRPVRILHCPSETGIKGTAEVRRVIGLLRDGGLDIDYIELHGVSNAKVMETLKTCDLVIDQLFSDSPMAGLAREAAQFGRPVIIAGYAWDDLRAHLPQEEWPPSITCHPDRLEDCLRDVIGRGSACWQEEGRRAYEFVRRNWGARSCAERLLEAVYNPQACNLWVDPASCRYVWGCGMHALETVENSRAIMRTVGEAGFCLDSKPELLARTAALGSIPLMERSPGDIPELSTFDKNTFAIAAMLVERNAGLQARLQETESTLVELKASHKKMEKLEARFAQLNQTLAELAEAKKQLEEKAAKLENFRGMIKRRDDRIQKLESKLGRKKKNQV